jgi:hypothetical protein
MIMEEGKPARNSIIDDFSPKSKLNSSEYEVK